MEFGGFKRGVEMTTEARYPIPRAPSSTILDDLREVSYEQMERARKNKIAAMCRKSLDLSDVAYRAGGGAGGKLAYIEGHTTIDHLNEVFGPLGWNVTYGESTVVVSSPPGKLVLRVKCRLEVEGGKVWREDVGHGEDTRGDYEKAEKTAYTDALKRAARLFGPYFGLELYDKEKLKEIAIEKNKK